jgi:hypothetical protein
MSDDVPPRGPDPTRQLDPGDFDYRPLLQALRECRIRIGEMMSRTGARTQIYIEAVSLLDQIDTVARLTRVPAAVKFVRRKKEPRQT